METFETNQDNPEYEKVFPIDSYLAFDARFGRFILTDTASEIIYREKGIIRSYSGADEWCHNFFCQLMNLFSGSSPYSPVLRNVDFEEDIKEAYRTGHSKEVIDWMAKHKDDHWFICAVVEFHELIDSLPNMW